jgi:RimJ/RimL family protein N-acetyltransferase
MVCFEQLGEREVGYWLGKGYWGKGIATQALKEFLKHIGTRPLYAHVAKHNIAPGGYWRSVGSQFQGKTVFFRRHLANVSKNMY